MKVLSEGLEGPRMIRMDQRVACDGLTTRRSVDDSTVDLKIAYDTKIKVIDLSQEDV